MKIFVVCLLGCLSLALSEDEDCTERMEHIDRCIERGYATERLINCPVLIVDNPLGPKATRKCGKSEDILVDFCNKTECADETLVTEEPVTEAPTVAPEPESTQLVISADWINIPGGLTRVSGGSAGVWGVNNAGNIFTYVDGWQIVAGGLAHVAVGGTQVWGVNSAQAIFRYSGDNTWAHIAGGLTNLDVSENDHVWGINSAGSIFRRTGTETSENGDGWEVIEGGAVQVTVGPAGVWVVNSAGNIFYREGTYGDPDTSGTAWTHVTGGLKWVASGNDILVGVNANDNIFYRAGITADNPVGTEWVLVPGLTLSQIDVSGRMLYGLNSVMSIFKCPLIDAKEANEAESTQLAISAAWINIPGGLTRVSGGSAGVWGVNSANMIFTYVDGWQVVAGGLAHVAVGGTQVWGVNSGQAIFRYSGDNTWAHIAGGLTNLDVSENDHVWGINSAGSIFRRTGTETSENGDGWEVIEGGAVQVSVGPAGVWVVNSAGNIFYRDGTYGDPDTSGFRWSHVAGGLKWVASGDDIVVGVNANDSIFYRAGITADNPVGTEWVSVPGGLSQIDVSGRTVYGRNSAFGIFECPLIDL